MDTLDIASSLALLKENLLKLTVQDIAVVLICASTVYLLRARSTFVFHPSWRMDFQLEQFANEKHPGPDEYLPLPVVTDLESDQMVEIILVTSDYQLQVLVAPPKQQINQDRLSYITVQRSVQIPESLAGGMRRVIALQTGFIEPYNASDPTQQRTQVIIVLLANMEVLCFSSDLQLLWHKSLFHPSDSNRPIKALALFVTSHKIRNEDQGSIYISASFQVPDDRASSAPPMRMRSHHTGESVIRTRNTPTTVFCLNGDDGELRWRHTDDSLVKQKTDAKAQFIHWTKLSKYFLSLLPHKWQTAEDTRFSLLDMSRDPPTADSRDRQHLLKPLEDIIGLEAHHIEGLPFGGMRPHSPHEHVINPDTLALHTHEGIQLLSLATGELISRILLREGRIVYTHENNQRLVQIHTDEANCIAQAEYAHPEPTTKFTGSVCGSVSTSMWLRAAVSLHTDHPEDTRHKITPVLVPSIARRSGIFNSLMGRTLRSARSGEDSLFLTSSGRLTSFSPNGVVNWQTLVSSQWIEIGNHPTLTAYEYSRDDQDLVYKHAFQPSLTPLCLEVFGKQDKALVLGWDRAVLVDLIDGYTVAEMPLPCPPMRSPVLQDFNGDGHTDVILACQFGYIGLEIDPQTSHVYTAVVTGVVVLTVILLSWFCKPTYDEDEIRPYSHERHD